MYIIEIKNISLISSIVTYLSNLWKRHFIGFCCIRITFMNFNIDFMYLIFFSRAQEYFIIKFKGLKTKFEY